MRANALEPAFGPDGLVPVIAQDAADGRVLMLGYADAEAMAATRASGELHFHSRSRGRLWRKGETSGNVLRVRSLVLDCDSDAVLATVDPAGPTCHRGTRSCFDPDGAPADADIQGFAWLEGLWRTIDDRRRARPDGSYTVSLLEKGVDGVARKVVEEATEVVIAAKDDAVAEGNAQDRTRTGEALAGEVADLVYHSLVLLAERGLDPSAVLRVLRGRQLEADATSE
jgi:phosphoribosyl-ATP pyrophosphohydrolase/phosphoribosyl-AMP cyclohydrolase